MGISLKMSMYTDGKDILMLGLRLVERKKKKSVRKNKNLVK